MPSCPLGGCGGLARLGTLPPRFSVARALWNPGVSPPVRPCWEPLAEHGPAARAREGTERAQWGDPRLHRRPSRGQAECGGLDRQGLRGCPAGEWALGFRDFQQEGGPRRPRAGSSLSARRVGSPQAWGHWVCGAHGQWLDSLCPQAWRPGAGSQLSTEAAKGPQSRLHPAACRARPQAQPPRRPAQGPTLRSQRLFATQSGDPEPSGLSFPTGQGVGGSALLTLGTCRECGRARLPSRPQCAAAPCMVGGLGCHQARSPWPDQAAPPAQGQVREV